MRPIERDHGPRRTAWADARGPVLLAGSLVVVGLGCGGVSSYSAAGAPDGSTGATLGFGAVAVLCLLAATGLLALVLLGGNRVPRYVLDDEGIALWCLAGAAEVPWDRVVAAGCSHEVPTTSGRPMTPVKQAWSLELFVTDVDVATAYPRAAGLVKQDDPPRADLPRVRLRLVLTGDVRTRLAADVAPRLDGRWLGDYRRSWTGGFG